MPPAAIGQTSFAAVLQATPLQFGSGPYLLPVSAREISFSWDPVGKW
jgi:hypothetical protein